MTDYLLAVLFGIVEGITEFLPISSSAHLLLVHAAFNKGSLENAWSENLIMDLAVHIGTLFSVLVYFRKDVLKMTTGLVHFGSGKRESEQSRLLVVVIVGSIPALLIGAAVNTHLSARVGVMSSLIISFTASAMGWRIP